MLIDDKTRIRLIMVVWLALMIAVMGWEDLLLWVICGGALGIVMGSAAHVYYRRHIRQQRGQQELLGRMETQHQQYLNGDDRGIYGDAYPAHHEFNRLMQSPLPVVPPPPESPVSKKHRVLNITKVRNSWVFCNDCGAHGSERWMASHYCPNTDPDVVRAARRALEARLDSIDEHPRPPLGIDMPDREDVDTVTGYLVGLVRADPGRALHELFNRVDHVEPRHDIAALAHRMRHPS